MNKDNPDYNFNDPCWHLKYRPRPAKITMYEDEAIALSKRDVTRELFGLSYSDLMEMEIPMFHKINKQINDIIEERVRERTNLAREKPI